MGYSKKEEGGRREEMDRNKTVGRGWKRKHDVRAKDEKEKEQEEGDNKNLYFVSLHFLFTQIQTKKTLICLQACEHQSTVT